MPPVFPTLLALSAVASHPTTGEAPVAQYVRIEIYGEERTLSLAEVEVFSEKENVAQKGTATQSTTYNGAGADRAIDGVLDTVAVPEGLLEWKYGRVENGHSLITSDGTHIYNVAMSSERLNACVVKTPFSRLSPQF